MSNRDPEGGATLERVRARYEHTAKKCPECGHVAEEGNWGSETDGSRIVYRYVCPVCGAEREHVFDLGS